MVATSNDFLGGVLTTPYSTAFEPIRTNNAVLRISIAPLNLGLPGAEETLKLSLAGFSLPKNETAPVQIPYLNEVRKFAGQTVFDDISVSFHDYVDAAVARILWTWRYRIHDPNTGLRGIKSSYACDANIEHFAPDGGRMRVYLVKGIWPMSLDMGDIEMGADEAVRIQVRFACDKIHPAPTNAGEFGTIPGVSPNGATSEA